MDAEFELERREPGSDVASRGAWLIVLSDWLPQHSSQLSRRIQEVFANASPNEEFPTVMVVDDVAERRKDHRDLLVKLAEFGGIVLEPVNSDELDEAISDPREFALRQFRKKSAAISSTAGVRAAEPTDPHGYQEFGKAVTKVSPDDLKQMVDGRDSSNGDSWRYEW